MHVSLLAGVSGCHSMASLSGLHSSFAPLTVYDDINP